MDLAKAGVRALGVAESYRGRSDGGVDGNATEGDGDGAEEREPSRIAGVAMRADGRIDGVRVGDVTVGGLDATEGIAALWRRFDREDLQAVIVGGLAIAWYNVIDLEALHGDLGVPVVSVTYEASPGLADALRRQLDGEALEERLAIYRRHEDREPVALETGETAYVRAAGLGSDDAARLVDRFTTHGKRPEPVRVARTVAHAVDDYVRGTGGEERP